MNPKVSIITVTYNCVNLLGQTIESVASQKFRDFEHLIIDGNSTDGTIDVIKANTDKISYWISEPDKGIYDAMNKGLKAARGEYVIFINAGDSFFENTTLGKVPFRKYPDADIFYGETMIVNEAEKELGLRRKILPHTLNWKHFKYGMVVCHQSILVKRAIAPEYNMNYRLSADVEWVLVSLMNARKVIFTKSIVSKFLDGGASFQYHKESLWERFIIMKKYFGLPITLFSHLKFFISSFFVALRITNKHRKPYL